MNEIKFYEGDDVVFVYATKDNIQKVNGFFEPIDRNPPNVAEEDYSSPTSIAYDAMLEWEFLPLTRVFEAEGPTQEIRFDKVTFLSNDGEKTISANEFIQHLGLDEHELNYFSIDKAGKPVETTDQNNTDPQQNSYNFFVPQ
ncbi:MAG: hypothetical protein ACRBDI_01350 [Alphaproteobacteria bacterium]